MEIETKIKPVKMEFDADDVLVLVLQPKHSAFDKPLEEIEICGRSIPKWIDKTIAVFEHKKIAVQKSDDIMSIVRKNAGKQKYIAVIYGDTPLLTRAALEQAISFTSAYQHGACKMPRGWVFAAEQIKTETQALETVEIPNLPDEDFIVAYNWAQVALIAAIMRARINAGHLNNGVIIVDPNTAYIDADVTIGRGTRIGPGVVLRGECRIGKNCRITNFVEIKKSTIGDNTKIAHMSYVGDAQIGTNCNIGCGVVFCNYNGRTKTSIIVGDNVFVGSNSNLVAPLTLENNSYVGAGSTITQSVPANALALGRAKQAIKENWALEAFTEEKKTNDHNPQ